MSDLKDLVDEEGKFIERQIIYMIKKRKFIYDESVTVNGDRSEHIQNAFDLIAEKITKNAIFHEITGILIFILATMSIDSKFFQNQCI